MEAYLKWAVVALLGYTMVAPLMKVATVDIPSTVAALVANAVLVVGSLAVVLYVDIPVTPYLTHPRAIYVYAAGVCLTVGILAYYQALATGPVSIVVPVFGMFIVTSSLVSAVWLGDDLTLRKAAGIGFAAVAVYLTAGPGQ
ncbi:EamA family transporter [Salarchaeum japonicum]|uniref:EamA domain-containing protein n=1 Tax=Salarchaeum japonicum TaxID=555573 RepID=A0AAV3T2G1_9EURY|nr:EamA family transporter [Salarchaeum japonicum]